MFFLFNQAMQLYRKLVPSGDCLKGGEKEKLEKLFSANIFLYFEDYAEKETLYKGYQDSAQKTVFCKMGELGRALFIWINHYFQSNFKKGKRARSCLRFLTAFLVCPEIFLGIFLLPPIFGFCNICDKWVKKRARKFYVVVGNLREFQKIQAGCLFRELWTGEELISKNAELLLWLEKKGIRDWAVICDSNLVFLKLTSRQEKQLQRRFPELKSFIR